MYGSKEGSAQCSMIFVRTDHLVAIGEQAVEGVRPDKSSTAGEKYFHNKKSEICCSGAADMRFAGDGIWEPAELPLSAGDFFMGVCTAVRFSGLSASAFHQVAWGLASLVPPRRHKLYFLEQCNRSKLGTS